MTGNSYVMTACRQVGAAIRIGALACAGVVTLAAPWPVAAHHSFTAEFDASREIKVSGEVSKLEWMNPHGWIHVKVTELCERHGSGGPGASDKKKAPWTCKTLGPGETAEWAFELASPNGLMRQGWTRKSLSQGDHVTIEGFRARDNSTNGNARVVTTADGKRLFAGSSQGAGQ